MPDVSAARAASVAYPCPQCSRESLHPTSTQGVNHASNDGSCRPTKPTNGATPGTSTAHQPKPCSANIGSTRSRTIESERARVIVDGKCSITTGSAFSAAKGSRSLSRQPRNAAIVGVE